MVILQHAPSGDDLLDFIDRSVRMHAESGVDARFVVLGKTAFERFREAVARRYGREERDFGTYQYLTVILDPFRTDECCVLPEPRSLTGGCEAVTLPPGG